MSPISVVCETCGAKLKVRDPDSVGQIHACPKCESMVMIAVPTSLLDRDNPDTLSAENTTPAPVDGLVAPSDFGAEVDHLLEQPAAETPTEIPEDAFAGDAIESAIADPESIEEHIAESLPSEPAVDHEAAEPTAEEQAAEQAMAADSGRTLFLASAIAGSVACFALGLVAAWWVMGAKDPPTPPVASATETPKEGDSPHNDDTSTQEVEVQKPVLEQPPVDPPVSETPAVPAEQPEEITQVTPEALPDLPPITPELPIDDPPIATEEEPAPNQMLRPLDPLSIDSANLDLLLVPDDQLEQPPADPPAAEAAAPPVQTNPMAEPPRVAMAVRELKFEPGAASRGPSYSENYSEGKLNVRMDALLPSISWRNAPLNAAFDELAQLASVPITIDADALKMAGITATHPVSLDASDLSVREVASALAANAKLVVEETPAGLRLSKKEPDRWWNHTYKDVDDLRPTGVEAEELAKLIKQFVSPNTWDDEEAKIEVVGSKLMVNQTTEVHYELLIFCERLRKARGLTLRTKYPSRRITIEPRLAGLSEALERRTTFAFVDWTSLVDVFDYWQETSQLVLLVDWQALADHDLRPLSTVAASVQNTKWRDALDTCLTPVELDWVPVDSTTISITTRDRAELDCWVEFYPGTSAEDLREAIERRADATTLAGLAIAEDSTGRFTIVRGNRQVHELMLSQQQ